MCDQYVKENEGKNLYPVTVATIDLGKIVLNNSINHVTKQEMINPINELSIANWVGNLVE